MNCSWLVIQAPQKKQSSPEKRHILMVSWSMGQRMGCSMGNWGVYMNCSWLVIQALQKT